MIRIHDLIRLDEADDYLAPLANIRPLLVERGIVLDPDGGDIIFADGDTTPDPDPAADGPPMILFDRDDGGFLWWSFSARGDLTRQWLLSDQEKRDTSGRSGDAGPAGDAN